MMCMLNRIVFALFIIPTLSRPWNTRLMQIEPCKRYLSRVSYHMLEACTSRPLNDTCTTYIHDTSSKTSFQGYGDALTAARR